MLKPVPMKKIRIIVYEKYIDDIIRTLGELCSVHLVNLKDKLDEFGDNVKPVEPGERYYRILSLFSRVERLIDELQIKKIPSTKTVRLPKLSDEDLRRIEEELKNIEDQHAKIIREIEALKEESEKRLTKFKEKIERLAREKGTTLTFEEILERMKREEKEKIEVKITKLREKLNHLAEKSSEKLLTLHKILETEKKIEEVKTLMVKTERTYILEGWVPTEKVEEVKKAVSETSENTSVIEVLRVRNHEEEKIPTMLKCPKPLKPYQTLTKSFGVPSYGEIDPTLLMSITFPIFFGLMFGDIGHGLLLLVVAILGFIGKRKNIDLGEIGNYIIEGSTLLLFCSVFSIFFGILYGEFFGFSIYHEEWYAHGIGPPLSFLRNILVYIFILFDFDEGVVRLSNKELCEELGLEYIPGPPHGPIWFSPFHEPWMLFILSIIIGAIHLSLGIFLDVINKIRYGEYLEGVLGPGMWLWFYIGLIRIVFTKNIVFTEWFKDAPISQPAKFVTSPVCLLLILPLILMFIGRVVTEGPIEGGMSVLESLIESISNTISYARILALNMAHEGFSKTFITLGGVNPEHGLAFTITPMFIMSFLVGTIFVMIMEGLLSFIHTLRLHWVEWFLKFYEGNGIEFKPFMLEKQYSAES